MRLHPRHLDVQLNALEALQIAKDIWNDNHMADLHTVLATMRNFSTNMNILRLGCVVACDFVAALEFRDFRGSRVYYRILSSPEVRLIETVGLALERNPRDSAVQERIFFVFAVLQLKVH